MDHPKDRYPVGSLVTLDGEIVFTDSRGMRVWFTPGASFLILDYIHAFHLGYRNERMWNVVGLLEGSRVESLEQFTGSKLMKVFTLRSDVRDGVDS